MCIRDRSQAVRHRRGNHGQGQGIALANGQDGVGVKANFYTCLLYTSDAADERSSVDLGGRRIIKKKKKH